MNNNVTMNHKEVSNAPFTPFEIHQVKLPIKNRDSPTFSILKTPTAIFVKTRSSGTRTKKLTFANGPVDLQTLRNGSHESDVSFESGVESSTDKKSNSNGDISSDRLIEVAISPVKTMEVSPESWKAFLEYKKYSDYSNETEKTDYTYSRLSKFRHKEIIPGFHIRPNLSRSSISSRRSSLSYPSTQTSLNESYQSGSYDFKVSNQSKADEIFDYIPNQPTKFVRSKYYLRSSNYGPEDADEDYSKSNYTEKEYFSQFPAEEEKFVKKTTYTTTQPGELSTPYYPKVRSINLDDADIDEVDVNADLDKQYRYSTSGVGGGEVWSGRNHDTSSLKNVFTTVFLYVTSIGTLTRDLFSKYVLRRENYSTGSAYQDFGWKDSSKYLKESRIPWGVKEGYSTAGYYSGGYYDRHGNWYQKMTYYIYDKFSQMKNFLWGHRSGYSSYHSYDSSKRKFWWFFIPLLLLAGIWLYKAEQDSGLISNQYKQLDCRTNGLLTSLENTIKPIWGSGYVAFKRISASASCYVNDSWERLKLPFVQMSERLSEHYQGFLLKIWQALWGALLDTRDFFSNICFFVLGLAADLITAVGNLFYFTFRNLIDGIILLADPITKAFKNFWHLLVSNVQYLRSYFYLLFFPVRSEVKYKTPETSETCLRQQTSLDTLKNEFESLKSLSGDLTSIKRKIDELEVEFLREKELRKNRNELYDRQLNENHKTLQKYQTAVNHALFSTKQPSRFSSSSVQYLLDNQSDMLKQWITQNFLLKSDSTGLDEKKFSLLLTQFTNKSNEELLALKEEFAQFVQKHKIDLESLRNNNNLLAKGGDVPLAYVNKIVGDAIKRYDADKTGKVDYALETAGGQVVSIRCTETYIERPKSYVFAGWSFWSETSSPRDAINPGVAPGQCWAFVGSQGFLVLQLSHTIRVTGFTMEHISRLLVPRGHIETAPRNFSMWGLKHEHDVEPHFFGEYEYLDNDETLQYFPVHFPSKERYNMVELKITSNHGNPNCTCLYRIRVHGDLPSPSL